MCTSYTIRQSVPTITRPHEKENSRALFVHRSLNTLNLPLVWLLTVKIKRLSSMVTIERDILYIIVRSNFNLLSSSDSAQRVLSLCLCMRCIEWRYLYRDIEWPPTILNRSHFSHLVLPYISLYSGWRWRLQIW